MNHNIKYNLIAILILIVIIVLFSYGQDLMSITGFSVFQKDSNDSFDIPSENVLPDRDYHSDSINESDESMFKAYDNAENSSEEIHVKLPNNPARKGGNNRNNNKGGGNLDNPAKRNISLMSPAKNTVFLEGEINFSYFVSIGNLSFCHLIIQNKSQTNTFDISASKDYQILNLSRGRYTWEIYCQDNENNSYYSEKIHFNVLKSMNGIDVPMELLINGLERVNGFYLRNRGQGFIEFLGEVNLSDVLDFDSVIIRHNFIGVDSEKMPQLNKQARLTFYGLSFENPVILRNGVFCDECKIIGYDNGNLVFNVLHFSNYTATENSQLRIWDDTDLNKRPGSFIKFYANYTDVTTSDPITDASCLIEFEDGSGSMTYNDTSKLYEYNRSFVSFGVYYYSISCSAGGYTGINLTDYVSIDVFGIPGGATVSEIESSSMVSDLPGNHTSIAGNLTSIYLEAEVVTSSWQGYYGNVSGSIALKDMNGNVFYNWNSNNPKGEVYASKANDVNFVSIHCADIADIINEEVLIGQDSSDSDSVSNTFYMKNHPEFYVGKVFFNFDNCNSTNIFNSSGNPSDNFYEVLLADNASNIVYTAILEDSLAGFNDKPHDFQMLVSEDGHDNVVTTLYYFYLEIS